MEASEEHAQQPVSGQCPVVGVGASAGGLEPLRTLISHLSATTGLAYVVLQHQDPNRPSLLADLLTRATGLPVRQVEAGMAVEADHIYVCPANAEVTLQQDERFHLGPYPQRASPLRVIDRLFTSLAQARKEQAVGVLLSGMGSDGTAGLRAIQAAGGLTFAQAPATAAFPLMPQSAIDAGCIDHVLSPEEIAHALAKLGAHAPLPPAETTAAPAEETGFRRILQLLSQQTHVDFLAYKVGTLKRRLENRMRLLHLTDLSAYLEAHPEEIGGLAQLLWIGVTDFFRDPAVWQALPRLVWPALLARRDGGEALRIWVPGCSTGEEAYSLAISLHEYQQQHQLATPFQIFATDINVKALATARAGIYTAKALESMSPARRARYFVPVDQQHSHYRIEPSLREHCIFAPHDLLCDPPFTRLHLISCRNVLIYMRATAQRPILQAFHYALVPQGFLLLGNAESIEPATKLFRRVERGMPLYQKQAFEASLPPPFGLSVRGAAAPLQQEGVPTMPRETEPEKEGVPTMPKEPELVNESLQEADRLLLANYVPASVVIDLHQEVVQVRGETGPYLQLAAGRASLNLFRMARSGLGPGLREAVRAARSEQHIVIREDLRCSALGVTRFVRVTVAPLKGPPEKQYCLVIFEEQAREREPEPPAAPAPPAPNSSGEHKARRDQTQRRIKELEEELSTLQIEKLAAQEEHEAAMEELQSANEEIRASNEELHSLNEELEASQEELQAINEELSTTNQELTARQEELKTAQEYAEAIVETARSPLVVLSADLRVEQANRAFYQLFQVTPAETEEHLFIQLGHGQWDVPQLSRLLAEIVTSDRSFQDFEVEHTFPTVGHRVLLLNARRLQLDQRPRGDHRILLAMEDITERRAAERQVEARLAFLRHLLDALPISVYLVQGSEARLVLANEATTRLWGAEWPLGQSLLDFLEGHAISIRDEQGQSVPPAALATMRAMHDGQRVANEQEIIRRADGTELVALENAVPFTDPELLTGLAAIVGNGQVKAAEPAVLVVHQSVQGLDKARSSPGNG